MSKFSVAILLIFLLQVATESSLATRSSSTALQGNERDTSAHGEHSDHSVGQHASRHQTKPQVDDSSPSDAELKEDPDYVPPRSKESAKPARPQQRRPSKTTKRPSQTGSTTMDEAFASAGNVKDEQVCECSGNQGDQQKPPTSSSSNKWKAQPNKQATATDSLVQLDNGQLGAEGKHSKAIGDILATSSRPSRTSSASSQADLDEELEAAEEPTTSSHAKATNPRRKTSNNSNNNNNNKKSERRDKREAKENQKHSGGGKYSKSGHKSSKKQQKSNKYRK